MKKILLYFVCLSCLACAENTTKSDTQTPNPFAHIKDNQIRQILQKSIATHGSLEAWESKKKLTYTKAFSLLKANGEVEKKFEQKHHYEYNPLKISIQSTENGRLIQTNLQDGNYTRTQDGAPLDLPKDQLQKAVNTSLYVIGIPFKLLDEGAAISYFGTDTIQNRPVDVLEVGYDAKQYDNHSTSDIWRYYFDQEDGKVLANWVQSSDHANLIENLTFKRAGGILFNQKRKSWRLDSLGNKDYLRADYLYDNFEVQ